MWEPIFACLCVCVRVRAARSRWLGSSSSESRTESLLQQSQCVASLGTQTQISWGTTAVAESFSADKNLLIFFPSPLRPQEIGQDWLFVFDITRALKARSSSKIRDGIW